MRETENERTERVQRILTLLKQAYPDARPELEFLSAFELLVATMLAAQCTDKQVNKCTRVLFPLYHTPEAFAKLSAEELEPYIRSCGFYKTKGRNIIETSRILMRDFAGEVPNDRDTLTTLPGVGRKTANVVVSNAFGTPAIAVDTHVFRVSNRMGLAAAKDVLETERQLMANIPMEDWSAAHHWLIFHGRRTCHARKPACGTCPVRDHCRMKIEEREKEKNDAVC